MLGGVTQKGELRKRFADGHQVNIQSADDNHGKGQQEKHTDVVRDALVDGARLIDKPDNIEGGLYIACQRDQGVEKEDDTKADEYAAVRVVKV